MTQPTDPPGAQILLDRGELEATVARLGREVTEAYAPGDHPEGIVMVAVLKGAVIFLADLLRHIEVAAEVEFLAISAFQPDSGRVRIVKDLEVDIAGRHVVLVEDVVDTGLSLAYLLGELRRRGPASLEVCTLLDKQGRRILPVPIRFCGRALHDEFVIGYGLDFAGRYRNLDVVAVADPRLLAADPDTYVTSLYGRPGPSEAR